MPDLIASGATAGLVWAAITTVKRLDEVLVGNCAILFGYPVSLALTKTHPLLRKTFIAGIDQQKRSIILDGPVYRGTAMDADRAAFVHRCAGQGAC